MRNRAVRGIYLALALLTFFAVLAATAGAREALATRTQAVRQTIAANPSLSRTITVSSTVSNLQGAFASASPTGASPPVTPSMISAIGGQLRGDFDRGPVTLSPAGGDLALMTTGLRPVPANMPGTGGTMVKIEVTERQPFGQQMRLVAGRLPVATPAGLQVVMSTKTAARFGLHAGSTFVMTGPESASTGQTTQITVLVTGIVVPTDPTANAWTVDPTILAPDLQQQGNDGPYYWAGAVMIGPGEAGELENYFSSANVQLEWVFPIDASSLTGQQAQPLASALDSLTTQVPTLTGYLAPVGATLTTNSNLLFALQQFIATAQSVDTLLWLLYVSLTITGLAVLVLAGRMVAMRRRAELAVIRARGASLRQIFLGTATGAALVCVPAAVLGAVLAVLAVPGPARSTGRDRRAAGGRRSPCWSWPSSVPP